MGGRVLKPEAKAKQLADELQERHGWNRKRALEEAGRLVRAQNHPEFEEIPETAYW